MYMDFSFVNISWLFIQARMQRCNPVYISLIISLV